MTFTRNLNFKNSHPPIIVRFSNRDKRNELFSKRRLLKEKPQCTISAFGSSQISLHENLTAYRKSLFRAAKDAKEFLKFKFLWTSQGQIPLKRDSVSKAINISSFLTCQSSAILVLT